LDGLRRVPNDCSLINNLENYICRLQSTVNPLMISSDKSMPKFEALFAIKLVEIIIFYKDSWE